MGQIHLFHPEIRMILFCEDCGRQNRLDGDGIQGGKAVFHCTDCGYPNAFGLRPDDRFFSSLSQYPEIMGGFLFHNSKGIVRAQMPDILHPRDIETLGAHLVCTYEFGSDTWPDIQGMTALVSDKYLFVHRIDPELYAVVTGISPELPQEVVDSIKQLGPVI